MLREVHRRSRGPVIMNDAICVRDITREPLVAATCISGSRCVTRLIKIPRDLLRQAHGRQGRERGEKGRKERARERERTTEGELDASGRTRKRSVGGGESARHTLWLR